MCSTEANHIGRVLQWSRKGRGHSHAHRRLRPDNRLRPGLAPRCLRQPQRPVDDPVLQLLVAHRLLRSRPPARAPRRRRGAPPRRRRRSGSATRAGARPRRAACRRRWGAATRARRPASGREPQAVGHERAARLRVVGAAGRAEVEQLAGDVAGRIDRRRMSSSSTLCRQHLPQPSHSDSIPLGHLRKGLGLPERAVVGDAVSGHQRIGPAAHGSKYRAWLPALSRATPRQTITKSALVRARSCRRAWRTAPPPCRPGRRRHRSSSAPAALS